MARYDKYNPYGGGFRAPLAEAFSADDLGDVIGVGINSSGQVVLGAGQSGIVGVIVLTKAYAAGVVVDVMTDGEIIEFDGDAGTVYYAAVADGAVTDTATLATAAKVGFTVEATRLVVHLEPSAAAVADHETRIAALE